MADVATGAADVSSTTVPSGPQSRGRGRGQRERGPRGRGRGGHGRGSQGRDANIDPAHHRPPGGSFGARLTEAAPKTQGENAQGQQDAAVQDLILKRVPTAEDSEICFICASPIEHISIAPCNHQTCHICALRLRALYKTRACAHCRTEASHVVFTDSRDKKYQDFDNSEFARVDDNLGIKFEKNEILEDTILLLRYNCPDKDCDVACLGWPDLHRHVKSKHGKTMCDLCTRNKKVFTHEHELFTFGGLRKHEKFGDDDPGSIDQSGFKGHPECGFCRKRFYGDDELYTHCREAHERCHICDRRDGGRNPQYYLNYQELEKHFADAHFVCLDAECQANKTNVFESEMDLKAHQLTEHPNGLSKDARRDARQVNLSGFSDLRTPYSPQRNNRRERDGRGIGRGRDPNAEPLPVSSAQPLSRAELAYQRQMAIQSSQSVSNRTFGGQLTQPSRSTPLSATQPTPRPAPAPPATTTQAPLPDLANLNLVDTSTMSPSELTRHNRHQSVINRATNLLKTVDPTAQALQNKLNQFRTNISSYNNDKLTAPDLLDSFFALFPTNSPQLGTLVREVADLFEDSTMKRTSLLEAWNSWRSINEDYPSLPGPVGAGIPGTSASSSNAYSAALGSMANIDLGANIAVNSGRRVLKLKNSTAQSQRGSIGRAASNNSSSSADPFPVLGGPRPSRQVAPQLWGGSAQNRSSTHVSTAPASSFPALGSNSGNNKTNPVNLQPPPTMSSRRNDELFPSLPKAAVPNVLIAGKNTRGQGRSGSSTPVVNAWGTGGKAPTPGEAVAAINAMSQAGSSADDFEPGMGKKKGKQKKKGETLFHFG